MPDISHKVKSEYRDEIVDLLYKSARDKRLFADLLKDLFTPEELDHIALRWQIVKKLARNETQREISDDLKVSIGTITRGARMLRNKQGGFNRALARY